VRPTGARQNQWKIKDSNKDNAKKKSRIHRSGDFKRNNYYDENDESDTSGNTGRH
jgi:hypothetical protein